MTRAAPRVDQAVRPAAWNFRTEGRPVAASPHLAGHIHRSYLVTCEGDGSPSQYLLQRVNTSVFPDPDALMQNIDRVTRHIRARSPASGTLSIVATTTGTLLWRAGDGSVWRCYRYADGCYSVDTVSSQDDAFEAGAAFGRFENLLADLDPATLAETIPRFHDLGSRMRQLVSAIEEDAAGRVSASRPEIDAALASRWLVGLAGEVSSRLPKRVVHNDCKMSNVVFDPRREAWVVDLDTVMAGPVVSDFGDLVRSVSCTVPEDEPDPQKVRARVELVEAAGLGYLRATAPFISADERSALSTAGAVATFEQAVRFLADHLAGDVYFRVGYPGHNLVRTRAQLALLASLLEQQPLISAALERAWAGGPERG